MSDVLATAAAFTQLHIKYQTQVEVLSTVAGYPAITVPAGQVSGLPVGLSFLGPAWSEPKLLGYGFDFEQATGARALPKNTPALAADTVTY